MQKPKGKFIACREDRITDSSSSNNVDDYKSLGADQEQTLEAQALTYDVRLSSAMSQCRGGSLHNEIYLPANTRPNEKATFQCKFVLLSQHV